jgi:cell wall-associated NlpC family hydrolase
MHARSCLLTLFLCALLGACASVPTPIVGGVPANSPAGGGYLALDEPAQADEIVLYAYGLIGTGYQFGGRNPEAGLDCSGMVAYIVEQVSGTRLPHNAARIAAQTRPIDRGALQPGDLVFFNTLNRRHSHMGIYLGDGRFIHAPSSRGSVRIDTLDNRYFAPRFDGARTLVPST